MALIRSLSQTLITGVYRTGSEYLTQILNCHPLLNASMYRVNVLRFVYDRYNPIEQESNYNRALEDLEKRLNERYELRLDRETISKEFARFPRLDYGTFYDIVMSSLYLSADVRHWAEKNQLLWREIPTFLEIMPNPKAVIVIRDPRAVLASFKKYTIAPPPGYLGAIFNCYDAMINARRYLKELPTDRFYCVRYEDAARSPQETAERIWDFLGISGNYSVTGNEDWRDAYGKKWHVNSSFHTNEDSSKFDVEASVVRWKEKLPASDIALCEIVCGEVMKEFGYEPETGNPDWKSAMQLCASSDTIFEHLKHWLKTGQGIEAFPTDPLKPENWERN